MTNLLYPSSGSQTSRNGSAGEMIVIADLLDHGYEVYKAVNGAADTDLVVEIDNELYKVEVKTVGRDSAGTPLPATHYSHKRHDILAIVDAATKSVRYETVREDLEHLALSDLPFPELSASEQYRLLLNSLSRNLKILHDNNPRELMQMLPAQERENILAIVLEIRERLDLLIADAKHVISQR